MQFHPEHTFFLTMFVVPLACHLYFIQGDKARVIQTLLFVAGLNTLLQALFGTKLPAVVGGSFAYVIPIAYIVGDSSLQRIDDPQEIFIQTMRAIQGALIIASSIQIIMGYSQVWGLFSQYAINPVTTSNH
ncbi:nucleobase-ascorbate transporter 1-like isoform X1 [Cannabis sativa]|uniref:nucleobase-ascorbate transporter 1-like isoform X1 n=1 Tax=Cannabis sativa TaxID=3483 RepID=UPI0029CA214C|nr:nucleobase-ascorbate transporter 1-like isoform X1 [Cannabis sativa]